MQGEIRREGWILMNEPHVASIVIGIIIWLCVIYLVVKGARLA